MTTDAIDDHRVLARAVALHLVPELCDWCIVEIAPAGPFFYAEDYHQQYLLKNPGGYDCHVRSGVACPV